MKEWCYDIRLHMPLNGSAKCFYSNEDNEMSASCL